MQYIDTHAHVYSDNDERYPVIQAPTRPPGTSGTISSLKKLAAESRVSRICAIQPSSFYGWDNRFICDLALAEPELIAGICTLNPEDDSSPATVGHMIRQYGIRGIRSLPASDGHLDYPGVRDLWKACRDHDITINVFVKYDMALELSCLLDDFSEVRCVVDHCLIPASGPAHEKVLAAMLNLAQYPNVFAKLSFLPLGSAKEYPYSDLHTTCRKIIETFTPSRCVWGGSFPCELWSPRSTYAQNLHLFTSILGLDEKAQEEIFWTTPSSLWFQKR